MGLGGILGLFLSGFRALLATKRGLPPLEVSLEGVLVIFHQLGRTSRSAAHAVYLGPLDEAGRVAFRKSAFILVSRLDQGHVRLPDQALSDGLILVSRPDQGPDLSFKT